MKKYARLSLVLGLSFTATLLMATGAPQGDTTKKDMEKLQGTWILVADETNGKRENVQGQAELVIQRNKMMTKAKVQRMEGGDESEYKIDASKTPKELDLIYTGKPDPERKGVAKCIYRLSGNELIICCNAIGSEPRPTELKTKPKDGRSLDMWKRKKP